MNTVNLDERIRYRVSRDNVRVIRPTEEPAPADVAAGLSERIIGQPHAIEQIVPFVKTFQANLAPEARPAGVFLLLGPTGTGKTRTVEALAEVLHSSNRHMLKVDCGEYQMEHEVAKLIGAPPGYLGHRETHPVLTQAKLSAITTDRCGLSIVLFDEIEKAAPSMARLLLGILDKGTLRLGDNTVVNFEKSIIFLTSNVGARSIMKQLQPSFGFHSEEDGEAAPDLAKLDTIALNAARKQFSPEFMNRLDAVIAYHPLASTSMKKILDLQLAQLQTHLLRRLGMRGFKLVVQNKAKLFLLNRGASVQYGAREMKRAVHKYLAQPIALMVSEGQVPAGCHLHADLAPKGERLRLRAV